MRETVHVYPTTLDLAELEHGSLSGYRPIVAPNMDCALCQRRICQQWEDVFCADDPSCHRLVVHGLSTAKA